MSEAVTERIRELLYTSTPSNVWEHLREAERIADEPGIRGDQSGYLEGLANRASGVPSPELLAALAEADRLDALDAAKAAAPQS